MKKNVWILGLISGFIVSAIMSVSIISCYNDPEPMTGAGGMIIGYLSMLLAFSLIYVGVKNHRDKQNNGFISFGKAFKIGLFITLIASTIYVAVWAIVYNFFVPDYMEKYAQLMLAKAKATGSGAELEATAAEMKKYKEMYKNPVFFVLMTYAEILPVGLIVSIICALILKRKQKKEVIAIA